MYANYSSRTSYAAYSVVICSQEHIVNASMSNNGRGINYDMKRGRVTYCVRVGAHERRPKYCRFSTKANGNELFYTWGWGSECDDDDITHFDILSDI
jgi:hypothetical protein